MPLRVNSNISAINAGRHLNTNNRTLGVKLERLASGLRLNRASDDAAGLAVREGFRAEISGLKVNVANAEQATNLIQVAEGSLNEVSAILVRMRELSVQSSSSTVTDENREAIQAEFTQLTTEIDRIAHATVYNEQSVLTGYGNLVTGTSTALVDSNTSGVTSIKISGASTGTYKFVEGFEDAVRISDLVLGEGVGTSVAPSEMIARVMQPRLEEEEETEEELLEEGDIVEGEDGEEIAEDDSEKDN